MVQLSMKELKSEAEDLLDVADLEVGDSAHVMRKVGAFHPPVCRRTLLISNVSFSAASRTSC